MSLRGTENESLSAPPLAQSIRGREWQLDAELGMTLESLAEATFQLLKMQNWFDSILVVDDSVASEILAFRLSFLFQRHFRKSRRTPALLEAASYPRPLESTRNRLQVIKISESLTEKEVGV